MQENVKAQKASCIFTPAKGMCKHAFFIWGAQCKLFASSYRMRLCLPTKHGITVFHNRGEGQRLNAPFPLNRCMKRPFLPISPSLMNDCLNRDGEKSRLGNAISSSEDLGTSSADIHMRLVSEIEERYWRTEFSSQSFYVTGRGYDQYQPALELGYTGALQNPDGRFEDFATMLHLRWLTDSGNSLLPWAEVEAAVKAAWLHARTQMQALQQRQPITLCDERPVVVLHTLHLKCNKTGAMLQTLSAMPLNDFVKQVIDRHVDLMQEFADGLYALYGSYPHDLPKSSSWLEMLHRQWSHWKLRLIKLSPEDFLALCEQREAQLLKAYQDCLGKQLPPHVQEVLQVHLKQLDNHLQKLRWVQRNWSIER